MLKKKIHDIISYWHFIRVFEFKCMNCLWIYFMLDNSAFCMLMRDLRTVILFDLAVIKLLK